MNNIYYLTGFNNYFNRIVKKPGAAKIDDYTDFILKVDEAYNFIPNDYVNTSMVVNYEQSDGSSIPDDTDIDYILVTDEMGNIISRWFVVDRKRNLGGQFTMSLKRDLFADYYDAIMSSPVFVEKGYVGLENKLIYNKEGMSFNQIKKSETLLKDSSGTPWVVAYIPRNADQTEPIKIETFANEKATEYDFEYSLRDLTDLGEVIVGDLLSNVSGVFSINYNPGTFDSYFRFFSSGDFETEIGVKGYTKYYFDQILENNEGFIPRCASQFSNSWDEKISELNSLFYSNIGQESKQNMINLLNRMAGKIIRDTATGALFMIEISNTHRTFGGSPSPGSNMYNLIEEMILDLPYAQKDNNVGLNSIYVTGTTHAAEIKIQTIPGEKINIEIPTSSIRNNLSDAPWDMLAIPVFSVDVITGTDTVITTKEGVALSIGQSFSAISGGKNVFDVQMLPYCPCADFLNEEGKLDIQIATENTNYSLIKNEEEETVGIGFWCSFSSFRSYIPFGPINVPGDATEFKVNQECDMYRLVSPNYSGAFEFSAEANGGIWGFEANCTYKPFQPYIHVNPLFSGLYGKDFNDNRGLVCGGDFSLPSTEDSWVNYQVQNKSYKESFARQVENMEATYQIERDRQKTAAALQAVSGTIGGAVSGGLIGGAGTGGAIGAVAGAALSLGANIYGAAKDLQYADELFRESRSLALDQFNYSLQNIKALPETLSNVGAFDVNYKQFPFLEYYSCTEEEKSAFRNKLKYNGMTVMAIDNLFKYSGGPELTFIQGQLIRLEGVALDYHITAEIAAELHKGVYI